MSDEDLTKYLLKDKATVEKATTVSLQIVPKKTKVIKLKQQTDGKVAEKRKTVSKE